ncbi:hypothetical protein Glove_202g98 [Diversispora epigaea]|uniref:Uncharacterized protein n=1 Tax=Diversispora epigaea TaxID=1348612 RepID=A0A397IR05_9GLOM|nr:hypothetical protein Glove_202g98 [Diversispora epigaea]
MTEDNNNSRDRSKNMYYDTSPTIEINYDEELANLTQRRLKSHVVNINGKNIESTLDSGANWSTITKEFAKKLELEINRDDHEFLNTINTISSIIRQVSNKKIQISFCKLLEIVKPEIRLEVIDLVANPDISRKKRTPCKAKRKKKIFNDTTSEFPSTTESEQDSESDIEISE